MDPVSIGLGLMSLIGLMSGRRQSTGVTTATEDPMLQEVLNMQRTRMNQGQPLYEAIQRMAMGLLPTHYQRGFGNAFDAPRGPANDAPTGFPTITPPAAQGPGALPTQYPQPFMPSWLEGLERPGPDRNRTDQEFMNDLPPGWTPPE